MVLDPDIICVTESWTNDSLGDDEIKLDGYTLFRRDREVDSKGGGVLMYVRDILRPGQVEWNNNFPEQVWCKIKAGGNRDLFIGVCYRTPSENVYGHGLHGKMRDLILEVCDKNFVLFGDFNYRDIDWTSNCCTNTASVDTRLFLDCVNDCFVTQHVDFTTTDRSTLDLIFSKEPELVRDVQDLGYFSSSDHKLICCSLVTDVTVDKGSNSTMKYDYNKMNRTGIEVELRSTDWDVVCAPCTLR